MRNRRAAHRLGREAEAACAEHLRAAGWRIIGVRVQTGAGEIDILAVEDDTLVIVEVKARAYEADGLYAITRAKQKRLVAAAWAILANPGKIAGLATPLPPNIRFDAMAVSASGPPFHLRDAWREE
ncbi:MAG: YraN family protein [Alphaproteobacteria bacterium]|nr:YraN family protein [Alphaproteobacteria bacterium]